LVIPILELARRLPRRAFSFFGPERGTERCAGGEMLSPVNRGYNPINPGFSRLNVTSADWYKTLSADYGTEL